MFGDTTDLPLVVRTRTATGCGYGGQHSMDAVGLYAMFSGWRMVAPSNAFDYIGLFNSAMQSLDPVVIMEHHTLYPMKFPVPKDNLDYFIPLNKARVAHPGKDVTVLTYSSMTVRCENLLPAFAEQGVQPEIIDLRTVDLPGLDYETIGQSVRKTHAVVTVEQAAGGHSIGSRIAAGIQERFFDELDQPIACLTSLDIPNPVSKVLEAEAMISDQTILEGIISVAKRTRDVGSVFLLATTH